MTIDTATFKTRFPEFADDVEYPDERVQLFLDDVVTIHMGSDEGRWCNKYDIAQAYLAAHLLIIGTNSEAGDTNANVGPVSSKSAGGVSVTKAVIAKDRSDMDNFYMTTSYGQQFLNIRNTCFVGVLTAARL